MCRERRLEPGEHWVYATGAVGGPVLHDLTAITEMQGRKTLEAVQALGTDVAEPSGLGS